jgi:hypothetical protein
MTTIEQYLQGLFDYQFQELNLSGVLLKRGITAGVDHLTVSAQVKELMQADLLMVLFTVFSKGSESVTKGNWKRATGAVYVAVKDRFAFRDEANKIYARYGEIASFGMKDGTNLW